MKKKKILMDAYLKACDSMVEEIMKTEDGRRELNELLRNYFIRIGKCFIKNEKKKSN